MYFAMAAPAIASERGPAMTCRQLLELDPHVAISDALRRDLDRLKRQLLRQRNVQLRYVRIIERMVGEDASPASRTPSR